MQECQCFFDAYKLLTDETIAIFEDPDEQRRIALAQGIDAIRDIMAVDPMFLYRTREVPPGLRYLSQMLKQARPYILSTPVLELALDMVEKAGPVTVPYEPFLKLPFWIEFENAVGDASIQFVAIWATREPTDENLARATLLCPDMQQSKTLFFNLVTGEWMYEQTGACSSTECSLARYTKEREDYVVRASDMQYGCTCANAGFLWAQLVNVVNHLLQHRKEPMVEQVTEREVAAPYPSPRTRKEKVANSEARRKSRANITILSLSAPVQVSQRSQVRSGNSTKNSIEMVEEKISVESHWRVLIPGTGKPWKSLQIIPIASYERRQQPAEARDRYRVEQ